MTSARTLTPGALAGDMRHFYVAGGILFLAAVGWNLSLHVLGWSFDKKPVPPPAFAQFTNHRLTNFPEKLGPYKFNFVETDKMDGKADGKLEMREDDLELLGTLKHSFNWYFMSIYTRDLPGGGRQNVRLDITYYTGLLDAVPHVGERCIVAAGGTILYDDSGPTPVELDGVPAPHDQAWKKSDFYRTAYEIRRPGSLGGADDVYQAAQYHIFSMNGEPYTSWEKVRLATGMPTLKYCYFAKILVAPLGAPLPLKASDTVVRDFLRYALPEVLRFLPSKSDVEALKKAS